MSVGSRKDPLLAYNFAIEVQGLVAGGFSEVSGLQIEIDVHEQREGGQNEFVHRLAGPVKYSSNLVLKHGVTDARVMWGWYRDVMRGIVERKNVSVMLLDSAGEEKLRWNFRAAFPVKWSGPELKADMNQVAVETLELAHRGLFG